MPVRGAHERIRTAALTWPGVTAQPHQFGGEEYNLGKRELGHMHGDWLVDIPYPKKVRDEIVSAGRAEPHHILPNSGWISYYIRAAEDVDHAIELLRLSYDLAQKKHQPATDGGPPTADDR